MRHGMLVYASAMSLPCALECFLSLRRHVSCEGFVNLHFEAMHILHTSFHLSMLTLVFPCNCNCKHLAHSCITAGAYAS